MMTRYKYIEYKVLQLFQMLDPSLLNFPLNIIKIIQSIPDIRLWSYQYYSKHFNIPMKNVIEDCNSKSGCINYDPQSQKYMIMFNKDMPTGRINWTLAHELAHYFLNHKVCFVNYQASENGLLNSNANRMLEREADYFAACFLAPHPITKHLDLKSSVDMQNHFGLSTEASVIRYDQYLRWQKCSYKTALERDILNILK